MLGHKTRESNYIAKGRQSMCGGSHFLCKWLLEKARPTDKKPSWSREDNKSFKLIFLENWILFNLKYCVFLSFFFDGKWPGLNKNRDAIHSKKWVLVQTILLMWLEFTLGKGREIGKSLQTNTNSFHLFLLKIKTFSLCHVSSFIFCSVQSSSLDNW